MSGDDEGGPAVHEGVTALLLDSAPHGPVAQRLLAEAVEAYRKTLAHAARRLGELGELVQEVDQERATDILRYFFGIHSWPRVVRDASWSWDEAGAWLQAAAARVLLRED